MQYGIEVNTYKRVSPQKTKRKVNISKPIVMAVMYFIVGLLVSRVSIPITNEIALAPFGIAYCWALITINSDKKNILAFLSVLLGYITIYNTIDISWIYLLATCILFLYSKVKSNIRTNMQITTISLGLLVCFFVYSFIFSEMTLSETLFYSAIKSLSIVPIYCIFKYSLNCMDNISSNYMFNTEELISICLLACFAVVGIGNGTIYNISVQNIFSLFVVLLTAYIAGSGFGAAIGVCIGFISGIAGSDMIATISLYSVCGMITGVFKDIGKVFSVLAYSLSFFIVAMYGETLTLYPMIELLIAAVAFMLIPNKILRKIAREFNKEEKIEQVQDIQIKGIKEEFENRVDSLRGVLSTMSTSISNLTENDKLLLKNKESALVESLADRVCVTCKCKDECWGGDLHLTYSLFTEMISSCEAGELIVPKELEEKCDKQDILSHDVEDLISIYQAKETAKNRLTEGRLMIANHINSMSLKLGEMIREFESDVDTCVNIDKVLRKRCIKQGVRFEDIYSYTDNSGRLKIKITLKAGDDERYCVNKILPMINNMVKMPVSVCDSESFIDVESGLWKVVVEETPKFLVKSYSAVEIKDGEEFSGDNYYFGKSSTGEHITIVSDGMGSGAGAGVESKICIDLIEKYLESGYSIDTAVDVVNSVMAMKFSEDEKFATLDYNSIDLYTGEATFLKFGGVISFIKKGEFVEVVKNDSLPFGIIDNLEVDKVRSKLNDGDIVITITDGVIDVDKENIGGYLWLKEFLENYDSGVDSLARDILNRAKNISVDKVLDDMTVVVSKIHSVY